jgi:hypothetical protein
MTHSESQEHWNQSGWPRWVRKSKLTPAQRGEIRRRRADGEEAKVLAAEFGVSASYVRGLGLGGDEQR